MKCPACGGAVDGLLKCRDCGEDCLPQELRGAPPADARPISEAAVRAGLGPHALAVKQSGLGDLRFLGKRTPLRLWLLRAVFLAAGLLATWVALFR